MQRNEDSDDTIPQVSFASFVVSLAASAMSHLGDGPGAAVNLPMARQTIDLLALLQQKTQGNLDDEETELLNAVLYETRSTYVAKGG